MYQLKCIPNILLLFPYFVFGDNFKLERDDSLLEISSTQESVKVIHHNILQVIGDPAEVLLSCHSVRNRSNSVLWSFHGSEQFSEDIKFRRSTNGNFHDMTIYFGKKKPPVVKLECREKQTKSRRNILIYTGVDASPYMHQNGETVQAIAVNETMVVLPCFLKYPLNPTGNRALQLLKDGKIIRDGNYIPELGYILDITNLRYWQSFGTYECRVLDSTPDDQIFVNLNEGSFLHLKYKGYNPYIFYEKSREKQLFECAAPKSMFKDGFRWYFKMANASLVEIAPEKRQMTGVDNRMEYTESAYITFGSKDITHVVCSSQSKSSKLFYSSVRVKVEGITSSVILKNPTLTLMKYTKGTSLTCTANGHSVKFKWLKDGNNITCTTIHDSFPSANLSSTSLAITPVADDSISNYTCCGFNDWDEACKTFIIEVDYELRERTLQVYALGCTLGMMGFILGIIMTFCKISCVRRNIFHGFEIQLMKVCKRLAGKAKPLLGSFDKPKAIIDECI